MKSLFITVMAFISLNASAATFIQIGKCVEKNNKLELRVLIEFSVFNPEDASSAMVSLYSKVGDDDLVLLSATVDNKSDYAIVTVEGSPAESFNLQQGENVPTTFKGQEFLCSAQW